MIQQQITRLLKSQEKRSTDRVKWTKFQRIYLETKEQDEDMDKLGEGFKTCNIVHLQGNNNLLASKIEIKNEEIRKFNLEQLSKTNQSANLREKHFTVLEGTLREQRDSLYEIRMLENIVKSYLTRATNFKEELLQKLENLIGNTGLLHHSVLLRDFESLVQVMSETSEKMSQIVLECSNTTKKTNQMKETMLKMKKSQSH